VYAFPRNRKKGFGKFKTFKTKFEGSCTNLGQLGQLWQWWNLAPQTSHMTISP
jgi:hypothetical protein